MVINRINPITIIIGMFSLINLIIREARFSTKEGHILTRGTKIEVEVDGAEVAAVHGHTPLTEINRE